MCRISGRVLGAFLMLASCPLWAQPSEPERAHQVICVPPTAGAACPEQFDFQRSGPVAFLAFLRTATTPFSVAGLHKGWLQPSDIPELLDQLASTEPCAMVVMGSASYVPRERSTIGQEALFLLDGLRTGTFPATLHSHAYDQKSRDEIRRWALQQVR